MKNSIIQQLKSVTTLHADFRSGDANDRSPLARAVTITAPVQIKSGIGATFQGAGRIVYADHASGRNTTGSIVVLGNFNNQVVNKTIFSAVDGGGTRIKLSHYSVTQLYVSASAVRTITADTSNKKCLAINYATGGIPSLYSNGVLTGSFSDTITVTADDAPIVIGNVSDGSEPTSDTIAVVMEFSRVLTASEHASIYAELSAMKWPTKPFTKASSNNALYSSFKNIHLEGAPISVAARGGAIGQFLETTPFQFGDATARYSISTDTVFGKANTKVISCSTAGLLYMPSTQAFGEWSFDFYKGSGVLDTFSVGILADTIGAPNATGQDGYNFLFDAEERVALQESVNASVSNKFYSAASYLANQTWYKCRITRTVAGIFTVQVRGGALSGWFTVIAEAGANPTTADLTTITSSYFVIDLDAGAKIANIVFKPLA